MIAQRVLIIEDEPDVVYTIKFILQANGFDVLTTAGVAESLALLARDVPDLILLDLRLPDGDGWDILAWARADERLKKVPIVIVSAHTTPSTAHRAVGEGANGYITKPFMADQLVNTVLTHITPD